MHGIDGNISADIIFKYILFFFRKIVFGDYADCLVSLGYSLHDLANPIYW